MSISSAFQIRGRHRTDASRTGAPHHAQVHPTIELVHPGLVFVKTDLLRDFGLFASFAILGTTTLHPAPASAVLQRTKERQACLCHFISRINALRCDRSKPFVVSLVAIILLCLVTFLVKGTDFDANMHDLRLCRSGRSGLGATAFEEDLHGRQVEIFRLHGQNAEEAVNHFSQLAVTRLPQERGAREKLYPHTAALRAAERATGAHRPLAPLLDGRATQTE